tara:strand:- start:59129 stop:59356 length:228 start_codon:yes stop_codon:yes gene_type:complete
MKSFQQFTEARKNIEIPTNKAKEHASALKKMGVKVQKADLEGLVVDASDKKAYDNLKKYLLDNGWDQTDLEDMGI